MVPIIDDELDENAETLTLRITDVTGGGAIGDPSEAEVTILDNDDTVTIPIVGTDEFDTLTGSNTEDIIQGLAGNDRLIGQFPGDLITDLPLQDKAL